MQPPDWTLNHYQNVETENNHQLKSIRHKTLRTTDTFKRHLKTYLFT